MADTEISGFDFLFKTIVVGDGAVGKTAITYYYATGKFKESYKMTIGVEFTIKQIMHKGKNIKCQIWDTGGQEKFSNIRPLYYRGALGALVVFDVSLRESYDHLDKWVNEVEKNCPDIPLIIVGNKIDIPDREVTKEEGQAYARKKSKEIGRKLPYFETSAKTGETIKTVFDELVKKMVAEAEEAMKRREK